MQSIIFLKVIQGAERMPGLTFEGKTAVQRPCLMVTFWDFTAQLKTAFLSLYRECVFKSDQPRAETVTWGGGMKKKNEVSGLQIKSERDHRSVKNSDVAKTDTCWLKVSTARWARLFQAPWRTHWTSLTSKLDSSAQKQWTCPLLLSFRIMSGYCACIIYLTHILVSIWLTLTFFF